MVRRAKGVPVDMHVEHHTVLQSLLMAVAAARQAGIKLDEFQRQVTTLYFLTTSELDEWLAEEGMINAGPVSPPEQQS